MIILGQESGVRSQEWLAKQRIGTPQSGESASPDLIIHKTLCDPTDLLMVQLIVGMWLARQRQRQFIFSLVPEDTVRKYGMPS